MFQADGEENRFHWPGMGHVNGGRRMEFGPVEEAVLARTQLFSY
jgi:hypothetical protein